MYSFFNYGTKEENLAYSFFPVGCRLPTWAVTCSHRPVWVKGFPSHTSLAGGLGRHGSQQNTYVMWTVLHTVPMLTFSTVQSTSATSATPSTYIACPTPYIYYTSATTESDLHSTSAMYVYHLHPSQFTPKKSTFVNVMWQHQLSIRSLACHSLLQRLQR